MLETERLLIRDMRASDIDVLSPFMQSDAYWQHAPIEPPTAESVSTLVERLVSASTKNPRVNYHLVAVDKRSDQFVGTIDLHTYDPWQQGEMGWAVISSHTGQGLATEMSRATLRFGFGSLGLHRVQARCRSQNIASRRIMAKIGMREEGTMRDNMFIRGEWWSTVQGAILSTDPEGLPAPIHNS
jgi:ribosomal-protein-alanine N-acetyltransferase